MALTTILVIGATGMLGSVVTQQLLRDRYTVRALVRNIQQAQTKFGNSCAYVEGDVTDFASVRKAVDGVQGVHISLDGGYDPVRINQVECNGALQIVKAAVEAKVERLTYLSGMFVSSEHRDQPAENAKYRVEQALLASGLSYTIFKPTYFMDTLPRHIQGRTAMLIGRQPHPLHIVASNDFAQMVSRAFDLPEAAYRSFYVYGPEPIKLVDALKIYCQHLAPEKKVITMPLFFMQAVSKLFMGGKLDRTIGVLRLLQKNGEVGDPEEAWRVFGHPQTNLMQWCAMQATGPS